MQRKRRIQLSLATGPALLSPEPNDSVAPGAVSMRMTAASDVELDVDLSEIDLDAALATSRSVSDRHRRLGKETLQILAPMMVRPLARSAPPPPRLAITARAMLAVAAVAVVLTSASVALALS